MDKKKLVLIGPVYPYKGGIAHYTALLSENLRKKYAVRLISFKRQYPMCLYPGEKQKDYQNKTFHVEGTEYLIDTLNPLNWVLTGKSIIKENPELLIFQWWNPYFAPVYLSIINICKLFTKTKVLFICHNVLPHERSAFDKSLVKVTLRKGDYHIVQSKEDEEKLCKICPKANYRRVFHPTYGVFQLKNTSKQEARITLGIRNNEKIILYFGFIRKYKGLIYLIRAMSILKAEHQNLRLFIVGEFFDDKSQYVNEIEYLSLQHSVEIIDGYVPDQEVEFYFKAADLVALPYVSATQSGIVQIAYGFMKPVLVTNVGGLPEVVEHNKTGFIVEPKNPQQIADAIDDFYTNHKESIFTENIRKQQDLFSWDRLVEVIEELCF